MAQPALAHRVMYDGLFTFLMRILNVGCAAGLGILTARLLGPAGKGFFALPGVEAGLVASAFTGLGSATSYFLLNRRPGKHVLVPAFACASLFVAVGALAVLPIAFFAGQRWAALPAIATLPAAAAINLASGYAIGIKRVRYSSGINVALTVITLVLMAVGLFAVARTPWVAIVAWVAANIAVAIAALGWMLWHARRLDGDDRLSVIEFGRFALKVGAVNLVALLNYRGDLYIVALLTTPAQLGMYTVAVSAAESLLVPTQVAALVTSPHIGSLERKEAAQLTARCVRNNLLIALVVCGLLFAFASPVVGLLYGAAFLGVVPVLQLLLLGVLALSLGSPMSSYFTLRLGKPEVPLVLASCSAAICIATSCILVPRIGMMGAAIGSTAGYAVAQTAAIFYFGRIAKIGVRAMLVPTGEDFALYGTFLVRVYRDGRRLLGVPAVQQ